MRQNESHWLLTIGLTTLLYLILFAIGKGNNLHEVECVDGSNILVSMPKKYRHTVWLKKDDCLVVDPIEEGKKVKGEIVCVLPNDSVRDLISNRQWPSKSETPVDVEALLRFFTSASDRKPKRDDFDVYPPSQSESEEDEEGDEEAGSGDDNDDNDEMDEDGEESTTDNKESESPSSESLVESLRDKNTSRVQLVTSGVVTVTNVLTDGLDNDIQSLEFGADEESSDELNGGNRDLERHANTIRIQVNYDNANKDKQCLGAEPGASGD